MSINLEQDESSEIPAGSDDAADTLRFDWSVMAPEYLDILEGLPNSLRFVYNHLHELQCDQDAQLDTLKTNTSDVVSAYKQHHNTSRTLLESNDLARNYMPKIIQAGEDKVGLATKAYDLVDKYIRYLDEEMKKHGASLENLLPLLSTPASNNLTSSASNVAQEADGPQAASNHEVDCQTGEKSKNLPTPVNPQTVQNKVVPDSTIKLPRSSQAGARSTAHEFTDERAPARARGQPNKIKKQRGRVSAASSAVESSKVPAALQLPVDPNEPLYCLCKDVAYGRMIGCDSEDCPHEWFHWNCVGIKNEPKGRWFCPECSTLLNSKLPQYTLSWEKATSTNENCT